MRIRLLAVLTSALFLSACVAPGPRLSQEQEVELGGLFYERSVQFAGGEYNVTPALQKYVRNLGKRLAQYSNRNDLPYEFTVVNSSIDNALAMPGGKIVITRGILMRVENEAQLAFLLAHEIAHADARHSAQTLEKAVLLERRKRSFLGMIGAAGAQEKDIKRKLSAYTRQAELEADRMAMNMMRKVGYDAREGVRFMELLAKIEKEEAQAAKEAGEEEDQQADIYSSHPPTQERIDANKATLATLEKGGRVSKRDYRRNIASLLKTKQAYEWMDEAREAYSNYELKTAASKIGRALGREKRDAQFHVVRGLIRYRQDNFRDAAINFNRAKQRHKKWFVPYLMSGYANEKQGKFKQAKADFKAANNILKTRSGILGYRRAEIALINQGR